MYTRAEFEELRLASAREMEADKELQTSALSVLEAADRHRWIHQTNWFGEPVLNLPQDMFALQEIIFATRPQYIIEVGVAWGGSLLFYATLLSVLGGKGIIGIDQYIPKDLAERLASHGRLSELITLINGSSVDRNTVARVSDLLGGSREVLIVLDSNHTHAHVLEELRLYSPFVGAGHYVVVSDTVVENLPPQLHRPRAWGPGNNPKTALDQFLSESDRFAVDEPLSRKLLLTCNPRGYVKCQKD
jgi:cephalosporin hydroxylase